jgi:16S rRNA (guanine527-N7)-methyltransferase
VRPLEFLLSPFVAHPLDADKLAQFQLYLDLLLKWNTRINLTAVRDAEQVVQRHFGESIFAAEQLDLEAASTLIDLGSGAGFPGLPMAIIARRLRVTLIESQQKKVAFLREVIRTLRLENATAHPGRAEESSLRSQIVTMRAVERFESALSVAASLMEAGGCLTLLIGVAQAQIACSALPQFEWQKPIKIPDSRERVVMIGKLPPTMHLKR